MPKFGAESLPSFIESGFRAADQVARSVVARTVEVVSKPIDMSGRYAATVLPQKVFYEEPGLFAKEAGQAIAHADEALAVYAAGCAADAAGKVQAEVALRTDELTADAPPEDVAVLQAAQDTAYGERMDEVLAAYEHSPSPDEWSEARIAALAPPQAADA